MRRRLMALCLIGLGAILGLGAFGYTRLAAAKQAPPTRQTFPVLRGPISATVSSTGNVAAARQAKLAFRTSGFIESIDVGVGDRVSAGHTLARLGTLELERKLQQAESQLADALLKLQQSSDGGTAEQRAAADAAIHAAQLKLDDLHAGPTPADLQAAEASVAAAQASLAQADAKLQSLEGGSQAADRAAANAAVDSAQNALAAAEAKLADLDAGPTNDDLTTAQTSVQQAEATLRSAEARLQQARVGATPADIAAAQAADQSAQAALTSARTKLEQTRATADLPVDVASASAELTSAASHLHDAHRDLDQLTNALSRAQATVTAREAALAASQHTADQTCDQKGDSSAECQSAKAQIDERRAEQLEAEQQLKLLDGSGSWNVTSADRAVAAAQAAYDAARTRLAQAQAAAKVPVDLVAAQAAFDTASANAASSRAKLDQMRAGGQPADVIAAESDVDRARAGLSSARAHLQAVQDGPLPGDRVAAETAVDTARANLAAAQAKLAALSGTTSGDLAAARVTVASARSALDAARRKLEQTLAGASGKDLADGESALATALANRAKLEPDAVQVARDREAVRQAELAVDTARSSLLDAQLVAPFDGVVASIAAAVGDPAGGGASSSAGSVLTLIDTSAVQIEVSVPETDARKLVAGQIAQVTFDALPGQEFSASVRSVGPSGTSTQGVVTYPATLSLDTRGQTLAVGLTATARIVTAHDDAALVLPSSMVRRIGTQALVDVAGPDGATVPRPVRTGIVGDELTQIVEGVQEGDQVVAPAPIAATAAGLGEDSVTFSAGPPNGVQAIPAGPGQMIFRKSP